MRLEEIARAKALDCDTIELWFADEARIGQKNKITRRWAKRGTCPSAPRDQRTAFTYIFGAVCPKEGKGAALILPACNTEAMNLHLAEIAAAVAPAAHAILLVDQAGWHMSTRLVVPANITIILLPPKCPELNPVENVWQFMRENWLSNRVFKSYDDLVDHCCADWNTRPLREAVGLNHGHLILTYLIERIHAPLKRWVELDRLNKGGRKPNAVRRHVIYRLAEAAPDILGKAASVSTTGKFVELCCAVLVACGLPESGIAKAVPPEIKRLRAEQAKWRIGHAP